MFLPFFFFWFQLRIDHSDVPLNELFTKKNTASCKRRSISNSGTYCDHKHRVIRTYATPLKQEQQRVWKPAKWSHYLQSQQSALNAFAIGTSSSLNLKCDIKTKRRLLSLMPDAALCSKQHLLGVIRLWFLLIVHLYCITSNINVLAVKLLSVKPTLPHIYQSRPQLADVLASFRFT